MLDIKGYAEYLTSKKASEKLTKERLGLLERFEGIIAAAGITDAAGITEEQIVELRKPWNVSGRRNFLHNIAAFFNDYVKFIKAERPDLGCVAVVTDGFYMKGYIKEARHVVGGFKRGFIPIPDNYAVNPELLGELSNGQFVEAFASLRRFVLSCYDEILNDPLGWGYPDFDATEGSYNRVMDILFSFGMFGKYRDGLLTVDAKPFFLQNNVKRHKKIELLIGGFERMGLKLEGFGKKAEAFNVTYDANPHALCVLSVYANQMERGTDKWQWQPHRNSLCHRYVEDPATLRYEAVFHADMDYRSDKLREIQYWLHDEAERYGFRIDGANPKDKGCILYKKGSKNFLLVGEKKTKDGGIIIWSKTSFIGVFEREPKVIRKLCDRFPHVFRLEDEGKCCHENKCQFRMNFSFDGVQYRRCGLGNFIFEDLDLDGVKAILEVFLIENKIKG
jgi:hypothetical protein